MDEIEQIKKPFHGRKDNIEVTLDITYVQGHPILLIQLTDLQISSKFNLHVGSDYIEAQDFHFTNNIESIEDLYQYLVKQFDKLIIKRDGVIIVVLEVMVKKKLEKKQYHLRAEREEIDSMQQIYLSIQQMKKQVNEYIERNDKRIYQLELGQKHMKEEYQKQCEGLIEEIGTQINNLKVQREADIAITHTQILKIREEIERSTSKSMLKNEEILFLIGKRKNEAQQIEKHIRKDTNYLSQTLSVLSKDVAEQQSTIKSLQLIIKQFEERKSRVSSLMINPDNPHKASFKVREQFNALHIQRIGKNEKQNNYVSAHPLALGMIHSFQLKLVKTNDRQVILSIGTGKACQAEYAYQHRETLSYLLSNGVVYEAGTYRCQGLSVSNGSTLQMRVDLNEFKVEWRMNNVMVAMATISYHMRTVPLFLYVMMYHSGDEVQLFL